MLVDLLLRPSVERSDAVYHVCRRAFVGHRGIAANVGEQDGDEPLAGLDELLLLLRHID